MTPLASRAPAVAGRFYPGSPVQARAQLEQLFPELSPTPALGLVAPHAGWLYSGAIAAQAYAQVHVPDTVVVLCPNHTGRGARRALWPSGVWRLPTGEVAVDDAVAAIAAEEMELVNDPDAHAHEHAIEVHLPLLQFLNPSVKIVPIVLGGHTFEACRRMGEGLARTVSRSGRDVLIVASSDMSHYLPAPHAQALDQLAIARMLALDAVGLYQVVQEREISMCGFIPASVMLVATVALGAVRAELVRYGHSGEVTGDDSSVVGYAGLVVRGLDGRRPD
ncbi:MAG: AmmeMemoRadiSam system protein B [Polyangiaceae bacterium]|nr:AmmeMemoRadiSam system protein B [Polyangiaceae bacterium]